MTKLAFGLVLALGACTSKEEKYEKLAHELAMARFEARDYEQARQRGDLLCPDLAHLTTKEYLNRCTDRVSENSTRLALAEREMNKFMAGR